MLEGAGEGNPESLSGHFEILKRTYLLRSDCDPSRKRKTTNIYTSRADLYAVRVDYVNVQVKRKLMLQKTCENTRTASNAQKEPHEEKMLNLSGWVAARQFFYELFYTSAL